MKKVLLIFFICIGFNSFSQYLESELHFIDGSIKTGIARINIFSDKIIFKENKDAKKEKYNHKKIKKLILVKDSISNTFVYKKTVGRRAPKLLQQIIKSDNLSLYALVTESNYLNYYGLVGALVSTMVDTNQIQFEYYFVKNNDLKALFFGHTQTTSKRRLREIIKKHFFKCEIIYSKSKNKKFKAKDIPEIVKLFNENCNK